MRKNRFLSVLAAMCMLVSPAMTWGSGSDGATVSITGTVDGFAEWSDPTPAIVAADWDGHITAVDTPQTVTKVLTLYTNIDVTITPTAGANSGILTNGSATLLTNYKLTGSVDSPDASYKAAGTGVGQFFHAANTYALTHVPGTGSYTINLVVQMQSQAGVAPDAGNYTAGVVLTAAW